VEIMLGDVYKIENYSPASFLPCSPDQSFHSKREFTPVFKQNNIITNTTNTHPATTRRVLSNHKKPNKI